MLFAVRPDSFAFASPANTGYRFSLPVVNMEVIPGQGMAFLAMRLAAALLRCGRNHCRRVSFVQVVGREDGNLRWDSAFKPSDDYVRPNACLSLPILGNHPDAIEFDPAIGSPVSVLLRPRRPLAVLRSVVAVVVDSFHRMAWWARSHIVKEVGKAGSPSLTNLDSTPSVIVEVLVRSQIATLEDGSVEPVKRVRGASHSPIVAISGRVV